VSIATIVESVVRRHVAARVTAVAVDLGADPLRVTPETRLEELGLDSLDLAEMVQILELEFELKLFAAAHGRVHTIGDAIDLVAERLS
jgi:acyl carrier protein